MPSASNLKMYWGDLHNHCNITYGHGDMRDAFEAAKGQLDFVSVTPHAMWPDIPGADDPRLKWVIDYHTGAFKRLREGGYEKYVAKMCIRDSITSPYEQTVEIVYNNSIKKTHFNAGERKKISF